MRLAALILNRIAWTVPTLAGLVAIVFFISRVIPADPNAPRGRQRPFIAACPKHP
ncbi:MAG: hypothetical protein NZL87_00575 [Thermomicrobium sp.]|nr:hypothetical protein [Thermomicrobium sp.]